MPADEVRSILGQAALALSAAHEAGVVHRDVKPANIIVTPEGQAKLTDFGIARVGDGSGHTLTGEVLGTPDYISPEQALGEPATAASDIYSLGVVAHEMITGRKPFDMGTPVATAMAQVNDPPPPLPDDRARSTSRSVVEACLAKSPADRPADARAVAEAARRAQATAPTGCDGRSRQRRHDPRPARDATHGRRRSGSGRVAGGIRQGRGRSSGADRSGAARAADTGTPHARAGPGWRSRPCAARGLGRVRARQHHERPRGPAGPAGPPTRDPTGSGRARRPTTPPTARRAAPSTRHVQPHEHDHRPPRPRRPTQQQPGKPGKPGKGKGKGKAK